MPCTSSDLHVAIYAWNVDVVNECVKNKNIINSFWRGCTPVSSAIYLKRYDILQILVNNGANVNLCSRNTKMEPPLFAACRLQDYTAINILLKASLLDIDQCDFFGRTALWAAARYGTSDIVELLLNRGAVLNGYYDRKRHPLNAALQQNKKNASSIIQLLIRRGSLLESVSEECPLKWAVKHADKVTFQLLVSAGYRVKCEDWLALDKLPESWLTDSEFCHWIDLVQKNPASLFDLVACSIRKTLSVKFKSLKPYHVEKLYIPPTLHRLLLFQS